MTTRRAFLGTLIGGLLSTPIASEAQQPARMPRIGYLGPSSPSLEPHLVEAFRQGLRDLGYIEGQSITIEYRWAEGQDDRLPDLAADLVRLKVDVIVTSGTPGAVVAKQATKTIPIVMASSGDPVLVGLVASLARPGGNVTGFSTRPGEMEGKRLELLKRADPRLSRVAVLWNPGNRTNPGFYQQTQIAAKALRVTLQPAVDVRREADFEHAFATIAHAHPNAFLVLADRLFLAHRRRIVDFAANNRLPAVYPYREYVDTGGLMSYGPRYTDLFREAAIYVDEILKGMKPADLPVRQADKFDLIINVKTAKALGLTIPPSLLGRADEVIQ